MFQNMGPAPSGRSGHAMATHGSRVLVLGGESYTSGRTDDPSLVHVLDTSTSATEARSKRLELTHRVSQPRSSTRPTRARQPNSSSNSPIPRLLRRFNLKGALRDPRHHRLCLRRRNTFRHLSGPRPLRLSGASRRFLSRCRRRTERRRMPGTVLLPQQALSATAITNDADSSHRSERWPLSPLLRTVRRQPAVQRRSRHLHPPPSCLSAPRLNRTRLERERNRQRDQRVRMTQTRSAPRRLRRLPARPSVAPSLPRVGLARPRSPVTTSMLDSGKPAVARNRNSNLLWTRSTIAVRPRHRLLLRRPRHRSHLRTSTKGWKSSKVKRRGFSSKSSA